MNVIFKFSGTVQRGNIKEGGNSARMDVRPV
jgi:hypothetical protein